MTKEKAYIIVMGIMVVVAGILFVKQEIIAPKETENLTIEVKEMISDKVVYQANDQISLDKYQADCQNRGGNFNDCDTSCASDAQTCSMSCVYTCEVKPAEISNSEITNFEECVADGRPVMESYPRQCSANGQNFTENIGNTLEMQDMIQLTSPQPNQKISSPVTLEGRARGTWFFEASAPVSVVNWDGLIIGEGYITTKGDWMTEDFVDFTGEITFDTPTVYNYGSLILQKDNPSDLPANDAALEIPVKF
ncbi:MAG: Gmad2 immunoglobulin-like domain-containing protein [Patescibacteria group bacterium]